MLKIFNICIMSMRSVVPPKKKKKLGHSHSNFRKLRLKHFPLTNIRDIIKPELSLTQVRIIWIDSRISTKYKVRSRIAFLGATL